MHIGNSATSQLTQANAEQISALRPDARDSHIAEHIRGMVAATIGNLPIQASEATKNDAAQWQQWALSVADGLELPVLA